MMNNYTKIYQFLLILLLTPILFFSAWCGYKIYSFSSERTILKNDYSEVNNIQYGLLSVDVWRDNVIQIVNEQIDNFNLSKTQQDTLKTELNRILNALLTQADQMINEKPKTIDGKIKKLAVKTFIDVDKIRKKVPEFSQSIINEIKKPKNQRKIKFLIKDKLKELAEQTRDSVSSESTIRLILDKYQEKDMASFNKAMTIKSNRLRESSQRFTFALLACLIVFIGLWVLFRKKKILFTPLFILSVILALIALLVGLSVPMIEIDARIQEVNFMLIGKNLVFQNQILFYQSKSILDVVHILLVNGKSDSIFVGILILIFSVLFPITKLICTKIYLLGKEKWRKNKFLVFFAFKSGKWSMADVMVVAIFMAYIGFKNILDSQLADINIKTDSLTTIATNETSLQPGFLIFVCYILFGLILGVILKRITYKQNQNNPDVQNSI